MQSCGLLPSLLLIGDNYFLLTVCHNHVVAVVVIWCLSGHVFIINFIFHRIGIDRDGAKTHFLLPGIQGILCNKRYLYLIQCLCAVTVRPPQLRIFYGKRSLYTVAAKLTCKTGQIFDGAEWVSGSMLPLSAVRTVFPSGEVTVMTIFTFPSVTPGIHSISASAVRRTESTTFP